MELKLGDIIQVSNAFSRYKVKVIKINKTHVVAENMGENKFIKKFYKDRLAAFPAKENKWDLNDYQLNP